MNQITNQADVTDGLQKDLAQESFRFGEYAGKLQPIADELFLHGVTTDLRDKARPLLETIDREREQALASLRSLVRTGSNGEKKLEAVCDLAHLVKLVGTCRAILEGIDNEEFAYPAASRKVILRNWRNPETRRDIEMSLSDDIERLKRLDHELELLGVKPIPKLDPPAISPEKRD
jgi:hypothetical protein